MNDKVKSAYTATTTSPWTYADWAHDYVYDGTIVRDDDGDAVVCDGDEFDCSYCSNAERDAAKAATMARLAYSSAKLGDISMASYYATEAADLERTYGDAPTYSRFERACNDLWEDFRLEIKDCPVSETTY